MDIEREAAAIRSQLHHIDPLSQEVIEDFLLELPFIPTLGEQEAWLRGAQAMLEEELSPPPARNSL